MCFRHRRAASAVDASACQWVARPLPSFITRPIDPHPSLRPIAVEENPNLCASAVSHQPSFHIFQAPRLWADNFPSPDQWIVDHLFFWQCLQIKSLTRVELMACMDISVVDSDICPPAIDDCCGDSKKDKRWTMDVCSACQDMSGGCADSKATKNECTSSTNEWRGEKFAYWILLKIFHERYFFDWYLLHNSKTLVISIGFRKPVVYVLWCICLFLQRRSRSNDQLPKHY